MTKYMSDRMILAGFYDISEAQQKKGEAKGWHAYSSREELLSDESIDFVVVATPNDFHHDIVIAALEAGKNVMSEKPVTMSCRELEDMIEASEKAGKLFTVHQNRRYDPDYLTVKKIYDANTLGNVFNIQSRTCGSRGIPGDWRQKKSQGGGMVLDWGIHLIDQILMLFDDKKLQSVYAQATHITNDEVDDGFAADFRYENELTAHVYVGTSNFIELPRWYVQGENGTAIISDWDMNGEIVMVSDWENRDAVPVQAGVGLTKTMAPRTDETIKRYPLPYVENKGFSGEHTLYNNICDVIEGKAEPIVTLDQQRRLIKVIEAVFKSIETNEAVKF